MNPGDLVQFTLVGFNHVHHEVKIGIFLNETQEMVDQQKDHRRYANILDVNGEVVETYNYLKINYENENL
jgi:hypothetical protein